MLDSPDLARDPPKVVQQPNAEAEKAAVQRDIKLEELRKQLERNQEVSQTDQDASEKAENHGRHSPETDKGSKRRKVQWAGFSEEDHTHDRETHRAHSVIHSLTRSPHISLPMPAAPNHEGSDGDLPGFDAGSDGMQTPTTTSMPDDSRPGTPDEALDIPYGERDGLPLASSKRGRTFTREAAKLVAMHKAKSMFAHKRLGHSRANTPAASSSTSHMRIPNKLERKSHEEDPLARLHKKSQQAGGVLSALLKLYEQPPSVHSSQTSLVPSRPSSPVAPLTPDNSLPSAPPPSEAPHFLAVPQHGQSHMGGLIRDAASRWSDYHHDAYERPAAAKSKGGVFGALQASAIGLAGAATPIASTVAPAPERPGFKLNRHSLPILPTVDSLLTSSPEDTTVQPNRTAAVTPPLDRPNLQHRVGSHLSLSSLGKLSGSVARMPEDLVRRSENISKEHLKPEKYHHHSKPYKAKSSGSQPSSPKSEYGDEKGKVHRRKKEKKRQEEIFITMHVAAILQRQDFILRLARALMMFGAPSHRLEYQIQQTAKVLEIDCQVIYIVNFMIISFTDPDTHTSVIRFIKQAAGLDLGKLTDIAIMHWEVVHDKIGVEDASIEISNLMKARPFFNNYKQVAFGGWCSAMICIASFYGSFIDILVTIPLGCLLVATQCFIAARSDILSSIFEIVIAAIISFVASALASTNYFCYAAVTSSSIVLILPGWPVCVAALELQTRSIVSGSVRIVYAVVYSLFLGFGISTGANVWQLVSSQQVYTANDNKCYMTHPDGSPWWRATLPQWFYWLAVPGYALGLALRNQARFNKELVVMVVIAGIGWNANHWSTLGFPGRSDISSALGALVVGLLGNIWGKFFQSTAFIVACVPILFQLPSGLGNGGLLNFAATSTDSTNLFQSGWSVAQQLITVVIGLVVGLLVSCAVVYPFGNRRGGLMTF